MQRLMCVVLWVATLSLPVGAASAPAPEDFPAVEKLPDPFLFLDGARVQTEEDWARRRAEIKDLVLSIQYGHLPPAPGNVKCGMVFSKRKMNDGVTRREKHMLLMGPDHAIRAQVNLYFPAEIEAPCPVILNLGWDCPITKEVNERGYIFAGFGQDAFDRSEEGKPAPGALEQAYPDMEISTLAAWAWGASRMLDYLESLPEADASKVIITGHSRCGKAALLAGAIDERFAIVNPNGSGCGGAGLYRILGPGCEDLEAITRPERWQEWFHKGFRNYAGKEAHLPFDQHFMRALVAPRPLLSTDGAEDTWANPIGTQLNCLAAQPVYDFLGVPERNAMHFRPGGHEHNAVDYHALLDFADWHLFGKEPETEFNALPFPEQKLEVDWSAPPPGQTQDSALARRILEDKRLDDVRERAKAVVAAGFNAGDGYGEVWIRDLATFIDLACEVHPPEAVKGRLLVFFRFQGKDGNIVDGYIPREKAGVGYDYRTSDSAPDYLAHKNTVETDQESALVQAVADYVRITGDRTLLGEKIDGQTVAKRLGRALQYLRDARLSEKYGLIWGATTADWGDVQPEHEWGVRLDESSHLAIDIYDNAMFLLAIDAYLDVVALTAEEEAAWRGFRDTLAANARKHLWDAKRKKFVPHIYLDGSPFPEDFDEMEIYYHGGTTMAIAAGLLTREEVQQALDRMTANVKAAGAASIGLTLYPPYPKGFFKNPGMAEPYSYQNGGDWTWFGGRTIQVLVRYGLLREAYRELEPMVARVIENDGFYEWYTRDNRPRGSGTFRGSAGVLSKAILLLRKRARECLDATAPQAGT